MKVKCTQSLALAQQRELASCDPRMASASAEQDVGEGELWEGGTSSVSDSFENTGICQRVNCSD